MENSIGVILAFSIPIFDMEAKSMIESFQNAGIDEMYWPKEYTPRKAFQKALKDCVQGEEGFLVRDISPNKQQISAGLVHENKDRNAKKLDYDVKNIVTLDPNSETINGKNNFRTEAIADSYQYYRKSLGNLELLLKTKAMLFDVMAIEVLCFKAFFIPHKFKHLVDKVIVLFNLLAQKGAPVAVEVMGVDNNTETRNSVVQHFISQITQELDKETAFCLEQRKKYETGEYGFLKETAFRRLLGKVKFMEEQVRLYVQLLDIKPEEDAILWEKMDLLDKEISKNIDISQKEKKFSKKDALGLL